MTRRDEDSDQRDATAPAATPASTNDFERGFQGPLYGPRGAALFGLVCVLPFLSQLSTTAPLATFGPPVAAFLVGFGWMLGIMALIHWLGEQASIPFRRKRRILLAAFVVPPLAVLAITRILGVA